MRVMALDVGSRWIGVAVTDETGSIAMPHSVLARQREGHRVDVARLRGIVRELSVGRVVVGLPLNMDGSEGPSARDARAFAQALGRAISVPVDLHDERLSTFAARQAAVESGGRAAALRGRVDDVAAVFVLRDYLQRSSGNDSE